MYHEERKIEEVFNVKLNCMRTVWLFQIFPHSLMNFRNDTAFCRYPPLRSWLCVSRQKNAFGKISDLSELYSDDLFEILNSRIPLYTGLDSQKSVERVTFRCRCSKGDMTWPAKSKAVLLWSMLWAWGCEKKVWLQGGHHVYLSEVILTCTLDCTFP